MTTETSKVLQAIANRDARNAPQEELSEEYIKSLIALVGSPEGVIVFKALARATWFKVCSSQNGVKLVEQNHGRNLYVELIRKHLPKELIMEIET